MSSAHFAPVDRRPFAAVRARELERFARQHPRCAALARESERHYLFGVPMHWMRDWGTPAPLFVRAATDAQVVCSDGLAHADFCLADTAAMYGHSPPALVAALREALARGLGAMLPGTDAPAVGALLAERFGLPLWQMALSASDANRFCVRWARAVTRRPNLLVFDGCYHGTVDDACVDLNTATDGPATRARASLLGQVQDLTAHTRVVEFNDAPAVARALADRSVACVLAEPIMTNAGMVLPQPGFLEGLRAQCSATGTLLLIDETHTISSAWRGCAVAAAIEPDFLVVGKAIAGGVPCAVYGFTAALGERMRAAKLAAPPGHSGVGTTLAGNLFGLTALRATLEEVATPAAYQRMQAAADRLEAGLGELLEELRLQRALAWSLCRAGARIELQFCERPPLNARAAHAAMDSELQAILHLCLLNRGVIVSPFHNMMLCSPVTTERQVEALLAALREALAPLLAAG